MGAFQRAQGGEPVGGQQLFGLGVAVALHRSAGVALLAQATMDAGQDRRGSQVGVGVGTADAVFDMPRRRRPARHAQADGAVVDPPGGGQRCVAVGLEAPIRVGVGAKQQQRVEQSTEHAAHRMTQQRRAIGCVAGEQVVAVGIRQADMHVQAGARQVVERFGHKTGGHPVFVGHTLDQTLVAHGFVHGLQGIGAVLQGDFDLAGGVFGNRRTRRDALQLAGTVKVGQKRFDLLQFAQAIDLGRARTAAVLVARRLRAAVAVGCLVKQVELQLGRHHRVIAVGLERVHHLGQQLARVRHGGGQAFAGVHAHLHRRGGDQPPRHALQAAADRVGAAVDIAHVPDQAGIFHVIAVDGQAENGAGQRAAACVHRQQFIAVQQLAAWHAVVVEDKQLEQFNVRVVFKKGLGFVQAGKNTHGGSHTGTSGRRAGAAGQMRTGVRHPMGQST